MFVCTCKPRVDEGEERERESERKRRDGNIYTDAGGKP